MSITLKAARVNSNLTQKEAAKQLGINICTLINYETGKTFPTADVIKRIETLYNVEFKDLIFLS